MTEQGSNDEEWDVFIAYPAPADRRPEPSLGSSDRGVRCFLDQECIAPGDAWDTALERALQNSRLTAVLVSDRSDQAYYQREEIAIAVDRHRRGGRASCRSGWWRGAQVGVWTAPRLHRLEVSDGWDHVVAQLLQFFPERLAGTSIQIWCRRIHAAPNTSRHVTTCSRNSTAQRVRR
ncbi:MAG: toll/interleukin-1 receptor domain-containing protein [Ilumatobacteraceae bacterium]